MENNKYYIFQECVFVALGTQDEMPMRHILICDLPGFTIFFNASQTVRFSEEKKKVTEYKMRVSIFSTNFVSNVSHSRKNRAA